MTRCDNCNTETAGAVVRDQNHYCSTRCADVAILQEARRMLRYLWQQGFTIRLDAIEHDALYELMGKIDAIALRHSDEPQLTS